MSTEIPLKVLEIDPDKDVSYINLTLLDVAKTVETAVQDKIQTASKGRRFPMVRRVLANQTVQTKLATAASKAVQPSKIAKKLSTKMPKILMYMLYQKAGMTVAARSCFIEDAYVVMEFQVKNVDSQKLLEKVRKEGSNADPGEKKIDDAGGPVPDEVIEKWMESMEATPQTVANTDVEYSYLPPKEESATWKGWIVGQLEFFIAQLLPEVQRKHLETETLPPIIQSKITEAMGEIMEEKLAEKHLEVEIAVLPGHDQARYFFANIDDVRERSK